MVIKLKDGSKFTIEHVTENQNTIIRGRQRKSIEIVFVAKESDFLSIQNSFTPENLETVTIYYPDNETKDSTDEQLEGVAQQEFQGYMIVGEWKNTEIQEDGGSYLQEPVYIRKLSVILGQLQYGESI